jgi:DNA-binding PadR family transcriptional regulator
MGQRGARSTEAFLPLSPASSYILLALADGQQHGYAIMREVRALTREAVRLGPGTLYRVVSTLLSEGLIEEVASSNDSADDSRRRYYRLTRLGQRVLSDEARRLAAAVDIARAKRVLTPRTT